MLGHYDAVALVPGENRITQDPEDELIPTPFGQLPDIGVAERQQYLTLAVRDYLNEGGKLVHAGETRRTTACSASGRSSAASTTGLTATRPPECVIQTIRASSTTA